MMELPDLTMDDLYLLLESVTRWEAHVRNTYPGALYLNKLEGLRSRIILAVKEGEKKQEER